MSGLEALLLLGGAALLYIGNQARSVSNLNIFAYGIHSMSFEGMNAVAYLDLLVQNTSNVSISLNSFSGSVFVDNTLVGNVSNFTPTVSQGNSEVMMRVKVTLLSLNLVNELVQTFQYKNYSKNVELRATVNANGVQLPITLTFQIGQ